ncbi:2-phospho-L-lactate guanylyltransferase [Rathayibacter sp. VKM Ac-2803]|uniref:2-phospho-L-lactate guanylyltransferase n=1 Tax=Rathayibacter sp. VKM Ac-2803 TaxID=2609256 RepID=UPI001358A2BF|nr:2-phospho-L-lactate guanylyltransferase [Rathayibacter sp. VKM Ac-2803]MWV50310.1 2-phospho-L-lactate guanylyltransferase [Rathayibacter sp. VKM Ac-2803]
MSVGWSAVVVFKGRGSSKTRLDLEARAVLAEAFLLDTLAAARAAQDVATLILVTSDAEAAALALAADPALVVLADPGTLNSAVTAGVAHALRERPEAPVVALTGDLPALVPVDLDRALRAAVRLPAVVPDRAGTGTTALLLAASALIESAFGLDSFARHLAAGCTAVDVPRASTLRLDVDTLDDLRDAEAAGVGPRTARALAAAA